MATHEVTMDDLGDEVARQALAIYKASERYHVVAYQIGDPDPAIMAACIVAAGQITAAHITATAS